MFLALRTRLTFQDPWKESSGNSSEEKKPSLNKKGFTAFNSFFGAKKEGHQKPSGPHNGRPSGGPLFSLFSVQSILFGLAVLLFLGAQLFFRVNPGQQAVVLRFGSPHRLLGAGFHIRLPWPFENVLVRSVTQVNRISSEALYRGYAQRTQTMDVMLTGDENLVEAQFTVLWVISDLRKYLFNARNPTETLRSLSESVVRDIVAQTPIARILAEGRSTINEKAHHDLQTLADDYGLGIRIQEVMMGRIDPPQQVIDAYRDVQRARADQERVTNEAEGWAHSYIYNARAEANGIVQQARGERARMEGEAKSQTAPFLAALEAYKRNPQVVHDQLKIAAAQRMLSASQKVILGHKQQKPVFILPAAPTAPMTAQTDPIQTDTLARGEAMPSNPLLRQQFAIQAQAQEAAQQQALYNTEKPGS